MVQGKHGRREEKQVTGLCVYNDDIHVGIQYLLGTHLALTLGMSDLLSWHWFRQLTVADTVTIARAKCRFKLVQQSIHGIDALYMCPKREVHFTWPLKEKWGTRSISELAGP